VPAPATLDDVIAALGDVVDDAHRRGDRRGLFATVYHRSTFALRTALKDGSFDDPGRIEQLAVVFACRYLEACEAHEAGSAPSGPWRYAFARAAEDGHLALQHVLLGINAHIAFDLGLATSSIGRSGALASLRRDFFLVDGILTPLIDRVQRDLEGVSPRLVHLDRATGRRAERLVVVSLVRARRRAWHMARRYEAAPAERRPALLARWHDRVLRTATRICPPSGRAAPWSAGLVRWVHHAEERDVRLVLDALRGPPKPQAPPVRPAPVRAGPAGHPR
jgi:hypothetical protein